ncbi:MAG: VF530 family DNA-binding protein, partial [Shewanella sp.]
MHNMNQSNNPLHGIKLETIITYLVEKYGWEELGERFNIRCFTHDPSVKSSLRFLRKTQWARDKVEYLYLKANKLPLPPPKADTSQMPKKTAVKVASKTVSSTP